MSNSWYTIAIFNDEDVYTLENDHGDCTIFFGDTSDRCQTVIDAPSVSTGVDIILYQRDLVNGNVFIVEVSNGTSDTGERVVIPTHRELKEYLRRITYYSV